MCTKGRDVINADESECRQASAGRRIRLAPATMLASHSLAALTRKTCVCESPPPGHVSMGSDYILSIGVYFPIPTAI